MEASLYYCKKKVKNSTKPCYFKRLLFLGPQCLPTAPKALFLRQTHGKSDFRRVNIRSMDLQKVALLSWICSQGFVSNQLDPVTKSLQFPPLLVIDKTITNVFIILNITYFKKTKRTMKAHRSIQKLQCQQWGEESQRCPTGQEGK